VLAPDGYLFLGSAYAATLLDERFQRIQTRSRILPAIV